MEIFGESVPCGEVVVDYLELLGECKELGVGGGLGDLYHTLKVPCIHDIARRMPTEILVYDHSAGQEVFDGLKEVVGVGAVCLQVLSVRLFDIRISEVPLTGIAERCTRAILPASDDGGQVDLGDKSSEFCVALGDVNSVHFHSLLLSYLLILFYHKLDLMSRDFMKKRGRFYSSSLPSTLFAI